MDLLCRISPASCTAEQCGRHVLQELLSTEQQYLKDLSDGIERYGRIFEQDNQLPIGLAGKRHVLLANVTQIAALHRLEVLPLMQRHQQQLELLFERWRLLLERGGFYCYVLYTASQRASLKLYDTHELYFKRLQIKLADPLGLRSFLLKPVQRVTRYPLLLAKFIQTFYAHRGAISKRLFELSCRLETRLRDLLETANQSDLVNDIQHFNAFRMLGEAMFVTVGEFTICDARLRRCYSGKLFVFNTQLLFAEIKGKKLLFRGTFHMADVAFDTRPKSFVLFNKQRQCEFLANPGVLQKWEAIVCQLLPAARAAAVGIAEAELPVDISVEEGLPSSRTVWYTKH